MKHRNNEIKKLLEKNGFELARKNKHLIWKNPQTGQQVVTSSSGSDVHEVHQVRRQLARMARA